MKTGLLRLLVSLAALAVGGCGNNTTSLGEQTVSDGAGGTSGGVAGTGGAAGAGGTATNFWPLHVGGLGLDAGKQMVVTRDGSVYVVGQFSDGAAVGEHVLRVPGTSGDFLAKYRASGELEWLKPGAESAGAYFALDKAPDGSVYVVSRATISKYDSAGSELWALIAGDTYTSALAVSKDDFLFRVGKFYGTTNFGDVTLTATSCDAFVEKRAADGSVVWAQKAGGSYQGDKSGRCPDYAFAAATLEDGSVVVSGRVTDDAVFGTTMLNAGYESPFLARYDTNGGLSWVRVVESVYSLAATADNGFYALRTSPGNAFLTKFAADGSVSFSVAEADWSLLPGTAVAADDEGSAYVTGSFEPGAILGGIELTARGKDDMFVAKYRGDGSLAWVQTGGGGISINSLDITDTGSALAVDPVGGWALVTGHFRGLGHFGSSTMESQGAEDLFLLRYDAATGSLDRP